MVRSYPVVLVAAMTGSGPCAPCCKPGAMPCTGAPPWGPRSTTRPHWRLVRDEDVVVQFESAAWDVVVTWSGLLWAVGPQPWPARERAALTAGYLRAVADWVVLLPPARWSRLMRAGEREWPVGLSRPFAKAGILPRYAMGRSACSVARPRPELVGRAVPVSVLHPAERGACPDAVIRVGAPPSVEGAVLEVVLAPPVTSRALLPGCTLQPLGDGPLLAFLAGAAPPGLIAAVGAFSPVEEAPPRDQPGTDDGPEPWAGYLDLDLKLDADEDDEYRLS